MDNFITINTRTVLIITLVLVVMYAIYQFQENSRLSDENEKLRAEKGKAESNYLKLLEEYLLKVNSVPNSARLQLEELKSTYATIDENITAELAVAIELLDEDKEAIAVEKLTKIIENVLKQKIALETGRGEKRRTFMEAIKEAVKMDLICERLGAFMDALRVIRNEEAHDMNVQINKNETLIYLLTSVHVLCELSGTKK